MGKSYHDSCYYNHIAPRCALCGEIIKGAYLEDFWGNKYHPDHEGRSPACEYCGRFISDSLTGGSVQYEDGRLICGLCAQTAVNDSAEAENLFRSAREGLQNLGIIIDQPDIKLHLVGRDELKAIAGEKYSDPSGFVKYRQTGIGNDILERKFDIYFLYGMPKMHFISVAAHELMHVWQYLNAPENNDPALCEGSCNYASYLILREYPGLESDYLIHTMTTETDPYYGEGYRRVKKLVDDNGLDFWLEYLKSHPTFPDGY